jgi:hypothetical protein
MILLKNLHFYVALSSFSEGIRKQTYGTDEANMATNGVYVRILPRPACH